MDRVLVHDSTFGSNAQAMAAGLATLHVIEQDDVVGNARRIGDELRSRLAALVDKYEMLGDVRGRGLMIGIEFGRPSSWKLRPALDGAAGRRARACSRRPSCTRCSTSTGSSPRSPATTSRSSS